MSPGPDRDPLARRREDRGSRAWAQAPENVLEVVRDRAAVDKAPEGPVEKGDSDVKERREAEARWEAREHRRVVVDREAQVAPEADSSNPAMQ